MGPSLIEGYPMSHLPNNVQECVVKAKRHKGWVGLPVLALLLCSLRDLGGVLWANPHLTWSGNKLAMD